MPARTHLGLQHGQRHLVGRRDLIELRRLRLQNALLIPGLKHRHEASERRGARRDLARGGDGARAHARCLHVHVRCARDVLVCVRRAPRVVARDDHTLQLPVDALEHAQHAPHTGLGCDVAIAVRRGDGRRQLLLRGSHPRHHVFEGELGVPRVVDPVRGVVDGHTYGGRRPKRWLRPNSPAAAAAAFHAVVRGPRGCAERRRALRPVWVGGQPRHGVGERRRAAATGEEVRRPWCLAFSAMVAAARSSRRRRSVGGSDGG